MLDPFVDTTQKELREAWKKIEELEKENKELREQLEKERELYCGDVILQMMIGGENK